MSTVERAALLDGLALHDELLATVDERTLEIVERRRRTAVVRRRGWLVRRMLLAADLVGLVGALLIAEWIVAQADRGAVGAQDEILAFLASIPIWVVAAKLYGLYDHDEERTDQSTADDFAGVFNMVTVCAWSFWVVTQLTGVAHPTTAKIAIFWAAAIGLISVGRSTARAIARRQTMYLQNTVVVGTDEVGRLIAKKLLDHPEYGINLVGFVDTRRGGENGKTPAQAPLLGEPSRLPGIVRLLDVERVVIAFPDEPAEETLSLIRSLKALDVQVDIVPRLYQAAGPNAGMHMVEGLPLVGLPPLRLLWSSALLKRALDLALSSLALVVLAPLLLLIALAVKLDSRGPVLYRHARVGRRRRPIEVLKFRTMRLEACRGERYGGEHAEAMFRDLLADPERAREFSESYKLADDPRVTRIGPLLRRTSLDELPQLLNVIRGDLSLVGPRAITTKELDRYGDGVDDLLSVRPGVTGYWQINGRSRLELRGSRPARSVVHQRLVAPARPRDPREDASDSPRPGGERRRRSHGRAGSRLRRASVPGSAEPGAGPPRTSGRPCPLSDLRIRQGSPRSVAGRPTRVPARRRAAASATTSTRSGVGPGRRSATAAVLQRRSTRRAPTSSCRRTHRSWPRRWRRPGARGPASRSCSGCRTC